MSLPPPATITSVPVVPWMVSLPAPRTIVAACPKHELPAPDPLGSVSAVAMSAAVNEARTATADAGTSGIVR